MHLVSSFEILLQPLRLAMTRPSFEKMVSILTGWVLSAERTVTRMIVAAGVVGIKHHSAFHRLFAQARWSLDRLGLIVFGVIARHLPGTIFLSLDDTLARRRGGKMYGAGMHFDPILSRRHKKIVRWSHNWIVLAVIISFPKWPHRVFSLPILFRLYLPTKEASKAKLVYRTHTELALQMLWLLCKRHKTRRFHVVADSAYGRKTLLKHLPANCDLTAGLHLDARLHQPAPPRDPHRRGRPRARGARLPSPERMLQQEKRRLQMNLYGRKGELEIAEAQACLYAVPKRLVKIVVVEPLHNGCRRRAFYSTCSNATAEQVLRWYAQRWSLEVTFHDTKQYLGFEDPRGWTRHAVERTSPMAMLLYSFIVLWYAEEGSRRDHIATFPWYRSKSEASFRDMLLELRRQSLEEVIFVPCQKHLPNSKIRASLRYLLQIAA